MSELVYIIGIMGFTWLLIIGASALLPYYTKKSVSFGVAVPPEQFDNPYLAAVRQTYMWSNMALGGLLMILSLVALFRLDTEMGSFVSIGLILLFTVVSFIIYARSNIRVRNYKRNSDWTISGVSSAMVVDREDDRKLFSPWWYLTYLIPIGAIAALTMSKYDDLPAMLPTNYGIDGTVTAYTAKTVWSLMAMPLTALAMTVLFAGIGWMINVAKRQTDDPNVVAGLRHNRTFQIVMGRTMYWLGLAMILLFVATQLAMIGMMSPDIIAWGSIALMVFVVAVLIYVILAVGQGGFRLSDEAYAHGDGSGEYVAGDDAQWKFFGTFYYNPEDPSLFVERRVGVGWTFNIGHPFGKVLLALLGLILIGSFIWIPIAMYLETR